MKIGITPDGVIVHQMGGRKDGLLFDGVAVVFPGEKNYEDLKARATALSPVEAATVAGYIQTARAMRDGLIR